MTKSMIGCWTGAVLLAAALGSSLPPARGDTPAPDEEDAYTAVHAGTILTVSGGVIEEGIIVIRNGVVEAVGKNVEYPRTAEVIHAEDRVVMPGLVNCMTALGMPRYRRSGLNANLSAREDFRYDAEVFERVAACGFTVLGARPAGSGIPGAVYVFRPWSGGGVKRTLQERSCLLFTFTDPAREKTALRQAFEGARKEIEKRENARKAWEEKRRTAEEEAKKKAAGQKKGEKEGEGKKEETGEGKDRKGGEGGKQPEKGKTGEGKKEAVPAEFKPPPMDPRYAPLVALLEGKAPAPALIVLGKASDYRHLVDAVKGFEFRRTYLLEAGGGRFGRFGGRRGSDDFELVLEDLRAEKVPVVLRAVLSFKPYTLTRVNLAARCVQAGLEVSLLPPEDTVAGHERYLAAVGELVRAGLDRSAALRAMTVNPAEVLGIADRAGGIEKGKEANLLFLTGDPFDPTTRVDKVMIRGRIAAEGRAVQ